MSDITDLIEIVGIAECFPELCEHDSWTQLSIPETLTIPEQKPDIEQVNKVAIKVEIISQRVVRTPVSCGCSIDGNNLTGRKLIIEGVLNQKVFYVADVDEQSVHAAHFKVPFSTFIVIPCDTTKYSKFRIDPYVEDVFVRLEDKRTLFKNVALFLHATPTECYC
ncbi:DUF3794 domain-containing protein [Sporohalobacter salinus]|uniref:DUF3794 domain-containing protein n=1 Tax=Sporohalobacter salinus TaxID=1494606 RepID=UPI00195FDAB0|nr:DUF3794 domain-containing protein [Sporohalobacter salinus]MBM7625130.1 hypothetical protein [Sporohalobacter salinus]